MARSVSVHLRIQAENLDAARKKLEEFGATVTRVGNQRPDGLKRELEALQGRLDPAARAAQRLARDTDLLSRALANGAITAGHHAKLLADAQRAAAAQAAAARAATAVNDNLGRSFARSHQQMQVMNAAAVNTFQSLASGAPVMQTLVTQGAQLAGAFGGISVAALAVGGAAAVATGGLVALARAAIESGDAMTQAEGRLRAATGSIGAARDVYDQLYQISQRTGTAVAESAGQFVRFRIAGNAIGATNAEVVALVETVQKFGIVSGASTAEAQAGATQLAQALASGKLQGDELRSILENMPTLAQEIANQLGVPIGKLREMGEAGELSAERIFKAILDAKEKADEQFGQMPLTVERASNIMGASWERFTAEIDRSLGLSQKLARSIEGIAGWLNQLTAGMSSAPGRVADRLEARIAETRRELAEMRQNPEAYTAEIAAREKLLASYEGEIEGLRELQRQESRVAAQRQLRERQTQANAKAEAAATASLEAYKGAVKGLHPEEEARQKRDEKRAAIMAALDAGLIKNADGTIDFAKAQRDLAAVEREYQEALKKGEGPKGRRIAQTVDETDKVQDYINSLRRSAAVIGQDARERAINEAVMKAQNIAMEDGNLLSLDQIATIKRLAAARYDDEQATKAQADAQRDAVRAVEQFNRDVARVAENIGQDISENLWDQITGEAKATDALTWFKNLFKRIAVEALNQKIVMPIVTQVVGSMPGLFGISAPGGASGQTAGTGQGGAGLGDLSSLSNLFGSTGPSSTLYGVGSWLATSQLGQALGLSSAAGGAAFNAGVAAVPGGLTNAAVPVLTSAGGHFASGLAASPWGAVGSIGANLLGLGSSNPVINAASGTLGAVAGGVAGSAALGASLGSVAGPIGAVVGAFLATALGGLFGGDPEYPVAAGAVSFSNGRLTSSNAATDNDGDQQAANALVDSLSRATQSFVALGGLTQKGEFRLGLDSYRGAFRTFDPQGHRFDGGSYATADQAVIASYRKALADGVFEAGALVGKAIRNSTATELDDFLTQVDLANRIAESDTQLSELSTTLDQVQANAKKASTEGFKPLLDDLEVAKGAGIDGEYRNLVSRQLQSLFAEPVDFTESEVALATARGQAEAYKKLIRDLGLTISESLVDESLQRQIAEIQQGVRDAATRTVNENSGVGFLNQLNDAVSAWTTNQREFATLGMDSQLAFDVFQSNVQNILGALSEDQLGVVIANFDGDIDRLATRMRDFAVATREAEQAEQALADQRARAAAQWAQDVARLSGRVAIEQAINPGWRANLDATLALANVAGAPVEALRSSWQSFFDSAATGTATTDQLRTAFDALVHQLNLGAITNEQYASAVQVLTGRWQDNATVVQAAAQAVTATEQAIARIRIENAQAAIQTYQEQISAAEQARSSWESTAARIRQFRLGLVTGDLSPLDPQARLTEALRQYRETLARAQGGDEQAAADVQGLAQTALEAARGFYASSADYARIFDEVQSGLSGVETEAQRQARLAADQLVVLRQQLATQQATLQTLQQPSASDLSSVLSGLNAGNLGDIVAWARRQGADTLQAVLTAADARLGWQNNPHRYGSSADVQAIADHMSTEDFLGVARPLGFTGGIGELNAWIVARDKQAAFEAAVRQWGAARGFAEGGVVPHIPGLTSLGRDSLPAWLMPFEGVLNHRGMAVLGTDGLEALNAGRWPANDPWPGSNVTALRAPRGDGMALEGQLREANRRIADLTRTVDRMASMLGDQGAEQIAVQRDIADSSRAAAGGRRKVV